MQWVKLDRGYLYDARVMSVRRAHGALAMAAWPTMLALAEQETGRFETSLESFGEMIGDPMPITGRSVQGWANELCALLRRFEHEELVRIEGELRPGFYVEVSVCGWEKWQATSGLRPRTSTIEEKEEKEEKENPRTTSMAKCAREVFTYWVKTHGKAPQTKFTADRRAKVIARLREGYTVDQLKQAIDGYRQSKHHMGDNDSGKQYNDLELICRTGSKVEQGWGYCTKATWKPLKTLKPTYCGSCDDGWVLDNDTMARCSCVTVAA